MGDTPFFFLMIPFYNRLGTIKRTNVTARAYLKNSNAAHSGGIKQNPYDHFAENSRITILAMNTEGDARLGISFLHLFQYFFREFVQVFGDTLL